MNRIPHNAVELLGAHAFGGALGRSTGIDRVTTFASVVEVLVAFARASLARRRHLPTALATRDQCTQQIFVLHVARCPALVLRQAGPYPLLVLIGDERWNRYVEPLCLGSYDVRAFRILAIGARLAWTFGLGGLALAVGRHP